MATLRVGVLRGGPSSEYEISLKTGASILEHLSEEKYRPVDIFVDKKGQWHVYGRPQVAAEALQQVDVIINAMHGEYGEDGTVQKILEQFGTPYTGSASYPSSVGFNKVLTKDFAKKTGVKMAPHIVVDITDDLERRIVEIFRTFPHPSIVKPVNAGSSVGVSIVYSFEDLRGALAKAFEISSRAIVEQYVKGREATCGVVENFRGEDVYPLLPVEIIPPAEAPFFTFDVKYNGATEEKCPGNFSEEEKRELQRAARAVHQALGLRHYSRSDFIVTPRGVYFLEVNTLPGLAPECLLPKELDAVGCSFPDFLDHLVSLALRR